MTIYLYVKTHQKTGLKYLGKTSREDYNEYTGSGLIWKRHLKKHGKDYTTEILLKTETIEEAREVGIFFSLLFDVVNSVEWANLTIEDANGGENLRNIARTPEWNKRISESKLGDKNPAYKHGKFVDYRSRIRKNRAEYGMAGLQHDESTKEKQRRASIGNKNNAGKIWINDGNNRRMIHSDQPIPTGWKIGRAL
jgi:hypothetical protein